jgi:copper chaperone CopZ
MESSPSSLRQPSDPATGNDRTTIELAVEGMHCRSCALLIEETLVLDPGVDQVVVDLDSGRATVTVQPGGTSADAICATVTGLGYPATPLPGTR